MKTIPTFDFKKLFALLVVDGSVKAISSKSAGSDLIPFGSSIASPILRLFQ